MYRRVWNVPQTESERNYGWKPFLYTDSYFLYVFFWLCHGIWWRYGHGFICFVPFLFFLSVSPFPVEGYQFTQQYRHTHHQQPSDVNDSKASRRRCNAKCHVHSLNNIKAPVFSFDQRLFWSLFPCCPSVGQLGAAERRSQIKTKRLYFTQKSELCLFLCKRTQKVITEFGIYIFIYISLYIDIDIYSSYFVSFFIYV